jgi:hypothetical protein
LLVFYGTSALSYSKDQNLNEADSYSIFDLREYDLGVRSWARLSTLWKDAMSMTESRRQGLLFFAFKVIRIKANFFRHVRPRKREGAIHETGLSSMASVPASR